MSWKKTLKLYISEKPELSGLGWFLYSVPSALFALFYFDLVTLNLLGLEAPSIIVPSHQIGQLLVMTFGVMIATSFSGVLICKISWLNSLCFKKEQNAKMLLISLCVILPIYCLLIATTLALISFI